MRVHSLDLDAFERDGYLVLPGLLDARQVRALDQWADEVAAGPDVEGGIRRYNEENLSNKTLSRVEYLRPHHAGLRSLIDTDVLIETANTLLGESAVLFKDKINYKPPGGAAFEAHQDAQAGWLDYCPFQLTCMVSIDATDSRNGCLELAPGQHHRGLIGLRGEPLRATDLRGMRFVACPTAAGDVVFFGSFVPHRSGPNNSEHPRRVLYLTYNPQSAGDYYERYFADKLKTFPPDWQRLPGEAYRYRV